MNKPITAEIISVGTEILLGEIIDTNAAYLASRLSERGIQVFRKSTIGDNLQRLKATIEQGMTRADILIISGGLGPTDDDITRESIAAAIGETPAIDAQLLENLEQMFKKRKRPMPSGNQKQAWLLPSAEALENQIGTACGWLVRHNDRLIFALPGPPSEMKRMWVDQVVPRLPKTDCFFYHTTIRTCSIGESHLAELIADYTSAAAPGVGTYARADGVDVRVGMMSASQAEAEKIVNPVAAEIESRLREFVYGRDGETLVSAIMKLLQQKSQTFSCMESVTGGAIAAEVTGCPGISSCFCGSITAYNAEMKVAFGVDSDIIAAHGVVSAAVAEDMAKCARRIFNSDWGLATTGVAGPSHHDGKAPGTAWIAVAGRDGAISSMAVDWPGDRDMIRNRIRRSCLQLFWSILRRQENE